MERLEAQDNETMTGLKLRVLRGGALMRRKSDANASKSDANESTLKTAQKLGL